MHYYWFLKEVSSAGWLVGLVCSGLVGSGLIWIGLFRSGLVWSNVAWLVG